MSQPKHSPGPWTIDEREYLYVRCNLSDRKHMAHEEVVARVSTYDDARLIASAPEMLTWLKECIRIIETQNPDKFQGVAEHVNGLIARAEGKV